MDKLYDRALNDKIKNILLRLLSKQDDSLKKYLLKYYFDKWRKKANQMKELEKEAASLIQAVFRGNNIRRLINRQQQRRKLLNKIMQKLLKASDPNLILEAALAKWRLKAKEKSCNENAKVIQKFCRDVHNKILALKNKKD